MTGFSVVSVFWPYDTIIVSTVPANLNDQTSGVQAVLGGGVRSDPASAIPVFEKALKNHRITLPPRS